MPSKYQKSFSGDQNTSSANELGSHNKVAFFIDGPAIAMVIGFLLILVSAAIIYLIVSHAELVIFVVVGSFILISFVGIVVALTTLICFGLKSVSSTRALMSYNKAQEQWNKVVYPVGGHIVLYDPAARSYVVHNARDVIENRHYQPGTLALPEQAESLNMPSMYDLTLDKEEA